VVGQLCKLVDEDRILRPNVDECALLQEGSPIDV
jgi:hypothetical protein